MCCAGNWRGMTRRAISVLCSSGGRACNNRPLRLYCFIAHVPCDPELGLRIFERVGHAARHMPAMDNEAGPGRQPRRTRGMAHRLRRESSLCVVLRIGGA
jgi:hypothetical protein